MLFDLPRDQLETYRPKVDEPADFDDFWRETLALSGAAAVGSASAGTAAARSGPILDARPVETGLSRLVVTDIIFAGWAGTPVKAWMIRPAGLSGRIPCVIEYLGYGGGRGDPWNWLLWAQAGYAHFVMDTRGQGGTWLHGDTPDDGGSDYGPAHPGYMTRGIQSRKSYYYRRLMADAACAVDAAASLPGVDAGRIAVTGGSQGGGLAIAAAALCPGLRAVAPEVPFLCHFRRAVEMTDAKPYSEIREYLHVHYDMEARAFETLSYFDCVHFAARARAPALFSTALMDMTCPPSTVFAAYNAWAGEKDIRVYNWNGHEGGGSRHIAEKIAFFAKWLA
jgi:cephalosporin-C deacetylase